MNNKKLKVWGKKVTPTIDDEDYVLHVRPEDEQEAFQEILQGDSFRSFSGFDEDDDRCKKFW